MHHTVTAAWIVLAAIALPAAAGQPAASGGAVALSEPGKGTIASSARVTAKVVAIDKNTRTVTLKGPQGRTIDVVAGGEVRNFEQIRVGDMVVAQYLQALTLELKKGSGIRQRSEREASERAEPGGKPAAVEARQTVIVADVVAVDPAKQIVSLRGPKGRIVELEVQDPEQFKRVKKGDQVEAVYTEALALSVEPAEVPGAKKP